MNMNKQATLFNYGYKPVYKEAIRSGYNLVYHYLLLLLGKNIYFQSIYMYVL